MREPTFDGAEEYEATKAHLKERTVGHTPGPWLHEHRRVESGMYQTQVFAENGTVVANLAWAGEEVEPGWTVSARRANAHLIAAAPDFYRAAKNLLNADFQSDEWDAAMHGLDAAIQKAEGTPETRTTQ